MMRREEEEQQTQQLNYLQQAQGDKLVSELHSHREIGRKIDENVNQSQQIGFH
jgi:hypothetical protein